MKYEEFTSRIQEIIPELKNYSNLEEVKEVPYQFFWEFFGSVKNEHTLFKKFINECLKIYSETNDQKLKNMIHIEIFENAFNHGFEDLILGFGNKEISSQFQSYVDKWKRERAKS